MSYRGPDLDLRTPQWSTRPHEAWEESGQPPLRAGYARHSRGPIWVDERLLSCCNHAFDLALAHRAAEVRLEHVLHALTRLEPVAETLEARGVRVADLRRESGTIIASDIPAALLPGGVPRRSDELEDVLRRASAHAERRYAPAGVDDVVSVLLQFHGDSPGASLLARHTTQPMRELPEPFVAFRRLPPAVNLSAASADGEGGEPASVAMQLLERLQRLEMGLEKRLGELARTWSLFAERLNSLEQVILGPRPGEEADIAAVHERIGQLEHSLHTGLTEAGRSWTAVADKLKSIEALLGPSRSGPADGESERAARLAAIEEAIALQRTQATEAHASLVAEVKAVGGALAAQAAGADRSNALIAQLGPKLQGIAEALEGQGEGAVDMVMQKLDEVLGRVEAIASGQGASASAHAGDLKEVHEALLKLNANQHTLAGSLEQWRKDATADLELLGHRLEVLERESAKPVHLLERLSAAIEATEARAAERRRRWHWLRRWLFGTEDWVGASWPSEANRREKGRT